MAAKHSGADTLMARLALLAAFALVVGLLAGAF
jgi:hypothetical protein